MKKIGQAGSGVLLYLPQEGRGIGLMNKLRAYELQDGGMDTVEANETLGSRPTRAITSFRADPEKLGATKIRLLPTIQKKSASSKVRAFASSSACRASGVFQDLTGVLKTKKRKDGASSGRSLNSEELLLPAADDCTIS